MNHEQEFCGLGRKRPTIGEFQLSGSIQGIIQGNHNTLGPLIDEHGMALAKSSPPNILSGDPDVVSLPHERAEGQGLLIFV